MVLEQLFKTRWLEKKPSYSFLIGLAYSIIGIATAYLLFSGNPGYMIVAFIAILLVPSLNVFLRYEENIERKEKRCSLKLLFKDHKDIFQIYIFMFFGILIACAVASFISHEIFNPHLSVFSLHGQALGSGQFAKILFNNLLIVVICVVLSLLYGAGSILFLTWNASVWGAVLGFFIRQSLSQANPVSAFLLLLLPVLPLLILESICYVSASIVGGVVSKGVIREKLFSKKFNHLMNDGLILLVFSVLLVIIGAVIEVLL